MRLLIIRTVRDGKEVSMQASSGSLSSTWTLDWDSNLTERENHDWAAYRVAGNGPTLRRCILFSEPGSDMRAEYVQSRGASIYAVEEEADNG